jgi:ADP-ribose pyrophosphatase YjhB (NUDIX family)
MSLMRIRPTYAAAILEGHDNNLLIALRKSINPERRLWQFPRGCVEEGESPERAMRRIAKDTLGLKIEIVVGQPPFLAQVEGREVEIRFFICGILTGEATPGPYEEIRWITRHHLQEYEFDEISTPVVEWLLES